MLRFSSIPSTYEKSAIALERVMKYIPDSEIDPITFFRSPDNIQVASFQKAPNLDLLLAFTGHILWSQLAYFTKCVARSGGCGFEVISSRYDDEFDPEEKRWIGVQIQNDFGDEPIVISTLAYERFCLRLLDFAETAAKAENLSILNETVWSDIVENREQLRSRLAPT